MNSIRLTTRGKVVFGLFIGVLTLATCWMVLDIITPAKCKVPAAEMSLECKKTIYK